MTADAAAAPDSGAPAQLDDENPWPGLESFEENARAFFHGRDREAGTLLKRVLDAPVTVLYGRSGLGKTSLLRAGLFPLLRERGCLPIYVRFDLKPGAAPLASQLRAKVADAIRAHAPDAALPEGAESLWEYLHRNDFELWSATNYPLTPVIVLDQFEELFTLGGRIPDLVRRFRDDFGDLAENRIPAELDARIAGDAALAERLSLRSRDYKMVVSLREDFLAELEGWRRLIPALARSRMRLRPLQADQAFEAVYQPAARRITPELARRVVGIVAGEELRRGDHAEAPRTGADSDNADVEPALLSLFCRELNEERKRRGQALFDSALVEDAKTDVLSNYYLSCVRGLPPRVADFIESELITEKGFRNSYPRDDAVPAHLTDDELTGLIASRLLRLEDRYGTQQIELTHDVLTGVVREFRDRRRAEEERAALAARAERERQALRRAAAEREAELEAARERAAAETAAREQAQAYAANLAASRRVLRIAVAVTLVLALAAAAAGIAAFASWRRAVRSAQEARQQLLQTTVLNLSAHSQSRSAAGRPGGEYRVMQEVLAARALATELPGGGPGGDDALAAADDALFNAVVSRDELVRILWLPDVAATRFSPDRRRVVASDSADCAVAVWDSATAGRIGSIHPGGRCRHAVDAGARRIWTAAAGAGVRAWDVEAGQPVGDPIPDTQGGITAIEVSGDGGRLFTGGGDGSIRAWDTATGQPAGPAAKPGRPWPVRMIRVSGDGRRLVTASVEPGVEAPRAVVQGWDAGALRAVGAPVDVDGPLTALAVGVDGRLAVTGGKLARVWDLDTGAATAGAKPVEAEHYFDAVAISADGRRILTGSSTGIVQLWDAATGEALGEPVDSGDRPVYFAALDDDGRYDFATTDGALRVRRLGLDQPPRLGQELILCVAIGADGRRVATGGVGERPDGGRFTTLRVRDAASGEFVGTPAVTDSVAHRIAFSPDGRRMVSGAEDGTARIWDVASGRQIGEQMWVGGEGGGVWAVAFSPDGAAVVTGDSGGSLRLWDAQTQRPLGYLGDAPHAHGKQVTGVAYSRDGRRVVSGSWDGTARVWDAATRQPVGNPIDAEPGAPDMAVLSVAISPDGQRVATGEGHGHGNRDDLGMVRVWDAQTGERVGEPSTHHSQSVRSVAFSPNGDWVVSGGYDGSVRVWSAVSGRQLGDPIPTDGRAAAIGAAFAEDGRRILFGTDSGAIQSRPGPDRLPEQLCAKLWNNMSEGQWADWVSPAIPYRAVCPALPVAPG